MLFVFGQKTKFERITAIDTTCPECGTNPCGLYWAAKKATAYFLPVGTLKRTYVVGCARCEKYWNIDQALAQRLHQRLQPEKAADAKPKSETEARDALLDAASEGKIETIKSLLKEGVDINTRNAWGQTALMAAVEEGHRKTAKLLMEKGADPNAREARTGKTALHKAIEEKHPGIAQDLLEKGADVNARDSAGWTPLIQAADRGEEKLVELLLRRGADVRAMTHKGFTAQSRAFVSGHHHIADLLKEFGQKN